MQISDFVVGAMAFVAVGLTCLALIGGMYDLDNPQSYRVNLSDDRYTKSIDGMVTNLTASDKANKQTTDDIYSRNVGEPNATFSSSSTSQSEVWSTSLLSLPNMLQFVKTATNLMSSFLTALGVDESDYMMTFVFTTIALVVALTLIGIVFYRPL